MIEIRIIDEVRKQDINIPNEPFLLYGRMIPSYFNERWQYEIVYKQYEIVYNKKEEISEMCFPNENYDYETMKKIVFLLALTMVKIVLLLQFCKILS